METFVTLAIGFSAGCSFMLFVSLAATALMSDYD